MLYRPLYLVIRQNPSPDVRKFVAFIRSPEGQNVIKQEGTVILRDGRTLWRKYDRQMKDAGITPGTF